MNDRKKEVIDLCLKTFMEKGLSETTVRDLSRALNLQCAGIYTYFANKDQAVIACAEEAALRIEDFLIAKALDDIETPRLMMDNIFTRSKEMRQLMSFFVSVCAFPRYENAMRPALNRLSERYKFYVTKFAEKLGCAPEDVAPYVYMTINTMLSYMLFSQDSFFSPQMELTVKVHEAFLRDRDEKQKNR